MLEAEACLHSNLSERAPSAGRRDLGEVLACMRGLVDLGGLAVPGSVSWEVVEL